MAGAAPNRLAGTRFLVAATRGDPAFDAAAKWQPLVDCEPNKRIYTLLPPTGEAPAVSAPSTTPVGDAPGFISRADLANGGRGRRKGQSDLKDSHELGPIHGPNGILLGAAFIGLLVVALVPVVSVDIAPLADYPNHIARMRILGDYPNSPSLQAIYRIDWALIPNLAMDLIVPVLARWVGVLWAGKIFVAMTLFALAFGTLLLHRTLFERPSLWPLIVFLFLYNYVLSLGFLNYLFGTAGALILFAIWIRSRRWHTWIRLVLFPLATSLLLLCHVGAVFAYGLMVSGYEAWRFGLFRNPKPAAPSPDRPAAERPQSAASRGGGPIHLALTAVIAGFQFVPPLAILLLASPPPLAEGGFEYDFITKVIALQVPFAFFHSPVEFAATAALLVLAFVVWRQRWIEVAPAVGYPLLGFLLAMIAIPSWLLGNWGSDLRLMVPVVGLLIAGTELKVPNPRFALAIAGVLGAILLVRVSTLTFQWLAYDRMFDELRAAAETVEDGSRILAAVDDWDRSEQVAPTAHQYTLNNAPALLALEKDVYLPGLFTAPGRQPLGVNQSYAATDVPHAGPMSLDRLRFGVDPESAETLFRTRAPGDYSYRWAGWPSQFDYLLMLQFDRAENPLPQILDPHRSGSFFTIYRVRPPEGTASP